MVHRYPLHVAPLELQFRQQYVTSQRMRVADDARGAGAVAVMYVRRGGPPWEDAIVTAGRVGLDLDIILYLKRLSPIKGHFPATPHFYKHQLV